MAGNHWMVHLSVPMILERRGDVGNGISDVFTVYNFFNIILICCTGRYTSKIFRSVEKALLPIGLC